MAKIIYSNIEKSLGNSLRIEKYNNEWHSGYWIGNHLTIVFDGQLQKGTIPEHTSLIVQHNGMRYQRNYDKKFSEHGLKIVCSRFQRDIMLGNLNSKSK